MADEIVKVIKIETAGGQQTVEGLRKEIKSLRDDLLNVQKGTKEYDETLGKLIEDEKQLTDVMRAGKNEVSAATGSYNALQNELTSLKKVWKEVTDESQRAEIGQRIGELNAQLKEMDSSIGNFQRNVGNYENALRSVTSEYTSQRAELKALRVELEQLDPGTQAYNEKFQRAAEITHNLAEQQEMLKYASNDLGDQLSNLRGIASNMAAGFSAANAAIGLFGGESKEVQQAMLKVQQAMALVQGLQGVDGFIKRTQGLSTAIKGWITQSKAATVQTTAQATATKAAAVATNAETVATEGATVAQKGLNAAMKANPIGLILAAVALLIANWKKLTEWLGKALGGWDKINKAMNNFKAVAAGVANVLKKTLLVPIKEMINYVTTLGKVIGDIFKGNWKDIGADLKEGLNNSIEIIKDGYDVAANYAAGKEKEITRQAAAEMKKRAQERSTELDDYIKDMEAKEGADWKYTEQGKQAYTEYFNTLLELYKNDAEKYKEIQRDKWSYDREFGEHENKKTEETKKANQDAAKKREQAAKEAAERLKKIEEDYQKKVEEITGNSMRGVIEGYEEEINALINYYEEAIKKSEAQIKKYGNEWSSTVLSDAKNAVKEMKDALKLIKDEAKNWTENKEGISMASFFSSLSPEEVREKYINLFTGLIEKIKEDIKKNNLVGEALEDAELQIKQFQENIDKIRQQDAQQLLREEKDMWNELQKMFGTIENPVMLGEKLAYEYTRLQNRFLSMVNDSIKTSELDLNQKLNDEIIRLFQKSIRPKVSEELEKLQNEIDKKTIKLDFEIETGMDFDSFLGDIEGRTTGSGVLIPMENFDKQALEFQKAEEIYRNSLQQLDTQLNFHRETVKYVNENNLIPSEEYEKSLEKIKELENAVAQVNIDYYNIKAEIRDRYFAQDIEKIQAATDTELREYTKMYNELYTKGDDYYNYRVTQSGLLPEHDIIAAQKAYEIQRDGLQKQLEAYQKYLEDVTVAGDQRVEAERMIAELIAEIEEGEVAHTIQMNELRAQAWGEYFNMVQDGINGIGSLFGSLADWYEADIKAKRDHKEMTQEEYEEAFKQVKKIKIAEATMSMLSGALGAFMQGVMSYPPPFGEILGGIGAAAAIAQGVAQIAQIKAQKPDGNGGNSGNYSAAATPQVQSFTPEYVENPTGDSELTNLRNSYMNQNIYVKVSDIEAAERGTQVRVTESSF